MDRRTGADTDGGTQPTGQTSRGYPTSSARNPKNNSARRPDVTGSTGPGLINPTGQTTREVDPTGYPESGGRNRFGKGNGATEPDPGNINRGYTEVTGSNVPRATRDTSGNRHNYSVDPGTPPQPNGDQSDGPNVPKYGVGTTGE